MKRISFHRTLVNYTMLDKSIQESRGIHKLRCELCVFAYELVMLQNCYKGGLQYGVP